MSLDDVEWVEDPDTAGGLVGRRSMPRGEAQRLCDALRADGEEASWAPDEEDTSYAYVYRIPWSPAVSGGYLARRTEHPERPVRHPFYVTLAEYRALRASSDPAAKALAYRMMSELKWVER